MPWVVKEWRCVADAERDARRLRRAADRDVVDAEAHLTVIEDLAGELMDAVRRRRSASRVTADGGASPVACSRFDRASLRDSPLTELFRATEAR